MRARKSNKQAKHPQKAAAARPFWSGTLSFGLVSIPVDFYPADRAGGVHSRWLAPDGVPLSRRYFCPEHGEEVRDEHLVRGYEREEGEYIVVTDEELEALDPEKSNDIALHRFVDAGSIDPLYFERGYFLGFSPGSAKAYRLLAEVMERTGRAGIASFVMRDKAHVVAIFAEHGLLAAQTLRFCDEVRAADDLGLPSKPKLARSSVQRMARAIATLKEEKVDPAELENRDSARLEVLVQDKARRGKDVVVLEDTELEETEQVVDLMKLLKSSLAGSTGPKQRAHAPRKRAQVRGAAPPKVRKKRAASG